MTTSENKSVEEPKKEDVKGKKKEVVEEELSEEDQSLKNELDMLVERLHESNKDLYKPALEALKDLIRTSTSSMTSVPKPLKFLGVHYPKLVTLFTTWPIGDNKNFLAQILSVLSMSYGEEGKRETLTYFMLAASKEDIGSWGHEHVRHLSAELMAEYAHRSESEESTTDLIDLAVKIVPFFLKHNAEADACDLLLELEVLERIQEFVEKDTYRRVCLYIISCVPFVTPPDDVVILQTACKIYRKFDQYPSALQLALKLNDASLISDIMNSCPDPLVKKQLAFILARLQTSYVSEDDDQNEIISNTKLSEHFISLARDLDVLAPKTPEDIYKSHLENVRPGYVGANVDSAKQNLASTFVNAFVNAGFGGDKLMGVGSGAGEKEGEAQEEGAWIYKNKDHGMMSAAASLGALLLWDVEMGLTQVDKYLYSNEDHIKAGALLAIGLVTANVRNESDPALALLSEQVNAANATIRVAAIAGLGIAYLGSRREEVLDLLLPLVTDTGLTMELSSVAALSLGLVYIGTCNGDITSSILQTMMERSETDLKDPWAKFMALGLSLLFLGKQDACEAPLETLKVIEGPIAKQAEVLLEAVAFGGTGNVLKVQKMLHFCNDHLDPTKEDDTFQMFAVLGIALIAMGEDVGAEMSLRAFNHLMHYGEPVIRRAVPLALGLLCASNPLVNLLDLLSKYSHDNDHDVSMNAIFAMGIVGAGTNNARLAQMLRQLAAYYHKEPNHLFVVRIAQGLLHMGKGTMTLNPFTMGRMLLTPASVAGLLVTLTAFTDSKTFIFGKSHWLLYYLIPAMYPRFLLTLDENLQPLPVSVRVGQAVDVVGQAGRPKTITGFQTHSTPVLLGYNERAELATEQYLPVADILEGFVILKKNPEWVDEDQEMSK